VRKKAHLLLTNQGSFLVHQFLFRIYQLSLIVYIVVSHCFSAASHGPSIDVKKILVTDGSYVASHGSLDVSQGSSQECFFHRFLQFIHYCLFFFISLSIASHGSSILIGVYPLSHL
jgi:hypothetical protein